MQKTKKADKLQFFIGMFICVLINLPFWINGTGAVITYHDQLDGELLTYILNAKYLFSEMQTYPELMNGIPQGGMISPAPGFILLFRFFSPLVAFLIMQFLIKGISFCSMYLLLSELTRDRRIAFLVGLWWMCLPFYPVYGLSIPGLALLGYATCRMLIEEELTKRDLSGNLLNIFLYGALSSPVLIGFAVIFALLILLAVAVIRRERYRVKRIFLEMLVLGLTYVGFNFSLFKQFIPGFSNESYISHKSEILVNPEPFGNTFAQILLEGEAYTQVGAKWVLLILAVAFISGMIWGRKKTQKERACLLGCLLINILIAGWKAFYQSESMVSMRNHSQGLLRAFNMGRFTWLMPFIWALTLAFGLKILFLICEENKNKRFLITGIWSLIGVVMIGSALYKSDVKPNAMKILKGGDYYALSWENFYAGDLFEQVDALIQRPKEEYRVVSLGIYPAAAAYNGFYCLDAYSNNYDVEYKHAFRKVIEPQLDKSEYLRLWFDRWGNRCVVVLAETGNYFTFEKKWGPYVQDYELNYEQLKAMGCEYILSAAYLLNWEEQPLQLLNTEPIQTEGSWYQLWVYKVL
ncbi:MAG: DUF6044 family protein [Lachnospiraceae bacterium]|nr:DUF6044 family protein [Lachnospiraceae bacterium]